MSDEDLKPGTTVDVIIETMSFPRGGAAVTGEVLLSLVPTAWERDGAEIRVLTSAPWERRSDQLEEVRRALARNALRLIKAAAELSEDQILQLLEEGLAEDLLPEAHTDQQTH